MTFKKLYSDLIESIILVDKLNIKYQSYNKNKYSIYHDEINKKIYLLYKKLYSEYNISYNLLSSYNITSIDKEKFINKRMYFINKLSLIRKELMFLKENIYPWPWININSNELIIPQIKKSIEYKELDYILKLSTKEYHIIYFN